MKKTEYILLFNSSLKFKISLFSKFFILDSIPYENQKARRLLLKSLGINKESIVIQMMRSNIDQKIHVEEFQSGLVTFLKYLNQDEYLKTKQFVVITEGTHFGISEVFGDLMSYKYCTQSLNIKLIGINRLQNIFSENELKAEVLLKIVFKDKLNLNI